MTEKKTAVGYLKKTVYSISDRSHRIPELFITSLRRAVCVGVELYFVFRLGEGKREKKKTSIFIQIYKVTSGQIPTNMRHRLPFFTKQR